MSKSSEFAAANYSIGQLNAVVKLLRKQAGEDGVEMFLRGAVTVANAVHPVEETFSVAERLIRRNLVLHADNYTIITEPESIYPPEVKPERHLWTGRARRRQRRAKVALAFRTPAPDINKTGDPEVQVYEWKYRIISRRMLMTALMVLRLASREHRK